ncbi:MAG: DoxX family protein [Patescibacteria group bacterium]
MLSVFPELFSYALVVPLVFRIVIGILFIGFGYKNITENREGKIKILSDFKLASASVWLWCIAIIEIISGVLLVGGVYTQVVALILSVFLIIAIIGKYKNPSAVSLSQETVWLLILVTTSLLFLGPGFYSFDLPL